MENPFEGWHRHKFTGIVENDKFTLSAGAGPIQEYPYCLDITGGIEVTRSYYATDIVLWFANQGNLDITLTRTNTSVTVHFKHEADRTAAILKWQ